VVLLIVLGGLYLTRPLWHGLVYGMLYSPSGLVLTGGSAVTALVLWFLPPSRLGRGGVVSALVARLFEESGSGAESPLTSEATPMSHLGVRDPDTLRASPARSETSGVTDRRSASGGGNCTAGRNC
jgi:hypothetical protein